MALTLKQTQEEELKKLREKYKSVYTAYPEYAESHGILLANIELDFLSAMESSARGAIEATRLEYEKTRHTWKKDCDCIQCYFINGFDQAVSDQATKAKDYLGDTHD